MAWRVCVCVFSGREKRLLSLKRKIVVAFSENARHRPEASRNAEKKRSIETKGSSVEEREDLGYACAGPVDEAHEKSLGGKGSEEKHTKEQVGGQVSPTEVRRPAKGCAYAQCCSRPASFSRWEQPRDRPSPKHHPACDCPPSWSRYHAG